MEWKWTEEHAEALENWKQKINGDTVSGTL